MNKQQAHQLLTQATAMLQLNREDHQKIVMALEVLKPEDEEQETEE